MRNRRLFRLLAILFAFTLVAAACGDDDDSTSVVENLPLAHRAAKALLLKV